MSRREQHVKDEEYASRFLRVFVGGLPCDARHEEVGSHFARYGQVININVVDPQEATDGGAGKKKSPFAFVTYKFAADADTAVVDTHLFPGTSRPLSMGFARRKKDKGAEKQPEIEPCQVFVGNIGTQDSEEELGDFFSQWGLVTLIYRDAGNWGYVHFSTPEGANRLLEEPRVFFHHRQLDCRHANPKVGVPEVERKELLKRAVARHFHKKTQAYHAAAAPPPAAYPPPGPGGYLPPPGGYPPASGGYYGPPPASSYPPPGGYAPAAGGPPPAGYPPHPSAGYYGGQPPTGYYGAGAPGPAGGMPLAPHAGATDPYGGLPVPPGAGGGPPLQLPPAPPPAGGGDPYGPRGAQGPPSLDPYGASYPPPQQGGPPPAGGGNQYGSALPGPPSGAPHDPYGRPPPGAGGVAADPYGGVSGPPADSRYRPY